MTVDQWEKVVTTDPFYKENNAAFPLSIDEKAMIESALRYEGSNHAGAINRDPKDFKGDTLLIGTGWEVNTGIMDTLRKASIPSPKLNPTDESILASINAIDKLIANIPSANFDVATGEKFTQEPLAKLFDQSDILSNKLVSDGSFVEKGSN